MADNDRQPVTHSTEPAAGTGGGGDTQELLARVYDELRSVAAEYLRREWAGGAGHTLQPTALVHEAYLRLAEMSRIQWRDRTHFHIAASGVIRRVLVDHARSRGAAKRGGKSSKRITLSESNTPLVDGQSIVDVLALDEALSKLHGLAERKCRVVELRFFGGLTIEQTAKALGVATSTVEDDWTFARAWLRRELGGSGER